MGEQTWYRQDEIWQAVCVDREPLTAVITGPKTGKTRAAAGVALWWALAHKEGWVRLAAPTENTLKDALWLEIHKLWEKAKRGDAKTGRRSHLLGPEPAIDMQTGWVLPGGGGIRAVSAIEATAAQGKSGANQLFIVDEAVGYPETLWAVIFRNLTGGGQVLGLSNHTHAAGRIYEAATLGTDRWRIVEFQITENPNFHGGHIDGLATPEGLQRTLDEYGENSPQADIALGRWPRTGTNSVVPFGTLQEAEQRHGRVTEGNYVVGVDPARFGEDDTGIVGRRGQDVDAVRAVHGLDTHEAADAVEQLIEERAPKEPVTIYVDEGGNPGVHDELAKRAKARSNTPRAWVVVGINSGERALNQERFVNRRAELWWGAREWTQQGGALPHHPRLFAELSAPTYSLDARQRIVIEQKKDTKKRLPGGKSPDLADAFCLSLQMWRKPTSELHDVSIYGQSRYYGWLGM